MSEEQRNSANYEVGYGKPPKSTQFKKGRSGNPSGRPKARPKPSNRNLIYDLPGERLVDTFLEEAYRVVNVGPGEPPMPIAQAVIRSLGVKAAKGHISAQRLFAETLAAFEAQKQAEAKSYMGFIIDYKKHWTEVLEHRAKHGLPLDPPVPHPDNIVYNMNRGTVEVKGPLCEEDVAKQKYYAGLLKRYRKNVETYKLDLKSQSDESTRALIEKEIAHYQTLIPMLERIVGEDVPLSPYEVAKAHGMLDIFDDDESTEFNWVK